MQVRRGVGALCACVMLGLGCTEKAATTRSDPDAAAIKALVSNLHFAGGVARLGDIPATTDSTVRLDDAAGVVTLQPGAAGLLPFDEANPHAPDDASEAVLLQFGDEPRHIAVPTTESVPGAGDINLAFDLDASVCEELCNRRYPIAMHAAIELDSGGVGALHQTEVVLDCRERGSEERCEEGEASEQPGATEPDPVSDAGTDAATEPPASDDAGQDAGAPSSLIGESGGSVSLPDGAEAVIPALAVNEPTPIELKVAAETPPLPDDLEGASEAYAFEPHGTTFDEPVTLRLPYTGSATGAQILRLDDEHDDTWEEAEGTPSFDDGVAELEVTSFSIYQVVRPVPMTVTPDDPCEDDNGGCDQSPMAECEADGDTRTCECPSGYEGDGVGDDGCTDVAECDTDNGGCDAGYECIEQVGDDPICDFDECTVNNGDCGDATYTSCDNQRGGAAPICADIDECATNNGGCGDAAYVGCVDNTGAAPTCDDIDECATDNGGCGNPTYVTCMDNDAAAHACVDILECATNNGGCGSPAYNDCIENHAAPPTCMNIDECATDNGGCGDPSLVHCTDRASDPPICTRLWAQISVSDGPMCARRRDGTIACTGYDYTGGNALAVAAASTDVIDVATGQGNACTIHADNHITCYGATGGDSIAPQTMAANNDPAQNFVDVEIGGYRLCALRSTGTLACFGGTNHGNGTTNVLDFDVAWSHVCVVHTDKTLQCFGTDTNGCVSGPNAEPGDPDDENNRYISVATGNGGTCALRENGTFICWGSASATHITQANANDEFDYVAISMGNAHTCGLHADGTATCWGPDDSGVITALNVTESAGNIAQIGVGNYGICVLRTDGSMQCHGSNTYGFQGLNVLGALP